MIDPEAQEAWDRQVAHMKSVGQLDPCPDGSYFWHVSGQVWHVKPSLSLKTIVWHLHRSAVEPTQEGGLQP
jgi:hypothetical protein